MLQVQAAAESRRHQQTASAATVSAPGFQAPVIQASFMGGHVVHELPEIERRLYDVPRIGNPEDFAPRDPVRNEISELRLHHDVAESVDRKGRNRDILKFISGIESVEGVHLILEFPGIQAFERSEGFSLGFHSGKEIFRETERIGHHADILRVAAPESAVDDPVHEIAGSGRPVRIG